MARHLGRICEASNIRVSPTREVGRTVILGCSWLPVNDVKILRGQRARPCGSFPLSPYRAPSASMDPCPAQRAECNHGSRGTGERQNYREPACPLRLSSAVPGGDFSSLVPYATWSPTLYGSTRTGDLTVNRLVFVHSRISDNSKVLHLS